MANHDFFPADYQSARLGFISACKEAGFTPESFENASVAAPDKSKLFADCVWVGPKDASNVVVTIAGTHGAEGSYGSGCQTGWLRERRFENLPDDLAILHIHSINPHGFAWLRRVSEGNVDLNRNFIDFANLPINEAYAEVHSLIVPDEWSSETPSKLQADLDNFVSGHGQKTFNRAVMGGQHSHPDGIFYGGTQPVWSNGLIANLATEKLSQAKHIAVIDMHTGLGPYGYAELICRHPADSDALRRARQWYGDSVTAAQAGESETPPVDGNLRMAFNRLCPQAQVTAIGIEVGTLPLDQVLMALYTDNWLHAKGDPTGPAHKRVMLDMRNAFYPDASDWTEPVYNRTQEVIEQAINGLESGFCSLRKA
jgi:hypothetical protein